MSKKTEEKKIKAGKIKAEKKKSEQNNDNKEKLLASRLKAIEELGIFPDVTEEELLKMEDVVFDQYIKESKSRLEETKNDMILEDEDSVSDSVITVEDKDDVKDYIASLIIPYHGRLEYLKRNLDTILVNHSKETLEATEILIITTNDKEDLKDIEALRKTGIGKALNIKIVKLDYLTITDLGQHFTMALQIYGCNVGAKIASSDKLIFLAPEIIAPCNFIEEMVKEELSYMRTIYVHWDINDVPLLNVNEKYFSVHKQNDKPDSWYASCKERKLYFMFSMTKNIARKLDGIYNEKYVYASDFGDNELSFRMNYYDLNPKEIKNGFALHIDHPRELIDNNDNKERYEETVASGVVDHNVSDWGNLSYIDKSETL